MCARANNSENLDPLTIPGNCPTCGFPNFNIWGVKQIGKLEIKITCMKCGKPNQKIIHARKGGRACATDLYSLSERFER